MQSMLEELYYGNIRPRARCDRQDSPYAQTAHLKHRNEEKLMAALDDSEKVLFEKYCDAQAELEAINRYDTFTYALKFGILLMTEVFMSKEEMTGEGSVAER